MAATINIGEEVKACGQIHSQHSEQAMALQWEAFIVTNPFSTNNPA